MMPLTSGNINCQPVSMLKQDILNITLTYTLGIVRCRIQHLVLRGTEFISSCKKFTATFL